MITTMANMKEGTTVIPLEIGDGAWVVAAFVVTGALVNDREVIVWVVSDFEVIDNWCWVDNAWVDNALVVNCWGDWVVTTALVILPEVLLAEVKIGTVDVVIPWVDNGDVVTAFAQLPSNDQVAWKTQLESKFRQPKPQKILPPTM